MRIPRIFKPALIGAAFLLPMAAFAQGPPIDQPSAPAAAPKRMPRFSVIGIPINTLTFGLGLTSEQKTKIKAIEDKLDADQKAMTAVGSQTAPTAVPGTAPAPPNAQPARELRRKADADIEAVLTNEQKSKIPVLMIEIAHMMVAGFPYEVYGDLNLTEDQKTRIAQVLKDALVLHPEEFKGLDPAAHRQKIAEIKALARDKAMAVLTPRQRAIVEKWEKDHPKPESKVPSAPQ